MQLDIALGSGFGASFGSKLVTTVGCGPAAASLPAAARRCFAALLSNVYIYIYINIYIYTYIYIYIYIYCFLRYVMSCYAMLCYVII